MAVRRKFEERYADSLAQADVWVWEAEDGSVNIGLRGHDGVRYQPYHAYQAGQDWQVSLRPVPATDEP